MTIFRPLRPESDQILHLDCLRLIAAIGVVYLHFSIKISDAPGWVAFAGRLRGSLWVDLFFTISGFVIAFVYSGKMAGDRDYAAFMRKRFARLVPLHWLTLAAFIAIGVVVERSGATVNNSGLYDPACIVPNILLLHATGWCGGLTFNWVSWSISAEMIMYLLAPVFFWLKRSSLLGLLIVPAFAVVALLPSSADPLLGQSVASAARAVPSFMVGIFLFHQRASLANIPHAAARMWATLIVFVAAICTALPTAFLVPMLYLLVALGVAADQQGAAPQWVRRAAAWAQLTYSSYMTHALVFAVVVNFGIERVLQLHGLAKSVAVIGAFLLVWPVSYLSLVLFERPMRRALS